MAKDYKNEANQIAASHGGYCKSLSVHGVWAKTEWKCEVESHPSWFAPFIQVRGGVAKNGKRGSWCPNCAANSKVTRKEYVEFASRFGGKLIKMAQHTIDESIWRCGICSQNFSRTFNNMKTTNTFCTECSKSLSERRCKAALEQLFNVEFIKYRPKKMKGTGGKTLEIDLYNSELRLGIEHHGAQHYKRKKNWGINNLPKQIEHDRRKREYCKKNKITLIEIRQLGEETKLSEFKELVKTECIKSGVKLPSRFDKIEINWNPEELKSHNQQQWERLNKEAKKRGWRIKSKGWMGVLEQHDFICELGHTISKRPSDLWNQGEGCPTCYKLNQVAPVLIINNKKYKVFNSQTEAANFLKTTVTSISAAKKRRGSECKGFQVIGITHCKVNEIKSDSSVVEEIRSKLPESIKRMKALEKAYPILASDGRIFESCTACAKVLGVTATTVGRASKSGGTCSTEGLTIFRISRQQEKKFKKHPKEKEKFLYTKKIYVRFSRKSSKFVLRDDGEIFGNKALAAKAIRANYGSVFRAIKSGIKCKGHRFFHISDKQVKVFKTDSREKFAFLKTALAEML